MAMAKKPKGGGKAAEARIRRAVERAQREIDHQVTSAQLLAFGAMDPTEDAARVAGAVAALEASPLAADGWAILAATAPAGAALTLMLWRQAVAAGSVALGPWRMAEMEGEFWGWMETRPYMAARAGLARELQRQGRKAEAVAELQEMLTLNPNDNQGMRHILLDWLLEDAEDSAAAALHRRYAEDGSATWHYGAVLLAFRREGDGPAARAALAEALAVNPHVPGLLLGRTAPPTEMPDYYSPGDTTEAAECAEGAAPAWQAAPGALEWLAGQVSGKKPAPRRPRKPRGGQ
jgi:tetratricopeptide (TPR) repeat protein